MIVRKLRRSLLRALAQRVQAWAEQTLARLEAPAQPAGTRDGEQALEGPPAAWSQRAAAGPPAHWLARVQESLPGWPDQGRVGTAAPANTSQPPELPMQTGPQLERPGSRNAPVPELAAPPARIGFRPAATPAPASRPARPAAPSARAASGEPAAGVAAEQPARAMTPPIRIRLGGFRPARPQPAALPERGAAAQEDVPTAEASARQEGVAQAAVPTRPLRHIADSQPESVRPRGMPEAVAPAPAPDRMPASAALASPVSGASRPVPSPDAWSQPVLARPSQAAAADTVMPQPVAARPVSPQVTTPRAAPMPDAAPPAPAAAATTAGARTATASGRAVPQATWPALPAARANIQPAAVSPPGTGRPAGSTLVRAGDAHWPDLPASANDEPPDPAEAGILSGRAWKHQQALDREQQGF